MNVKQLKNCRFGSLVAISPTKERNRGNVIWICKCDCGNEFKTTSVSLTSGRTISCGCVRRKKASENAKSGNNRRTHGMRGTKIYYVWCQMKQRCFNPKHKYYENWGGRGITVCDEWKNDFQAFYDYVSQLPHFREEDYSLDRINNDGNYEPGNVRWATHYEQVHNRRNSRKE